MTLRLQTEELHNPFGYRVTRIDSMSALEYLDPDDDEIVYFDDYVIGWKHDYWCPYCHCRASDLQNTSSRYNVGCVNEKYKKIKTEFKYQIVWSDHQIERHYVYYVGVKRNYHYSCKEAVVKQLLSNKVQINGKLKLR